MKFDLYGDGIGTVEYVQHMGEDITVVNAARVSFGNTRRQWMTKIENSSNTSSNTDTRRPWSTILLHLGLWYLFLCVVSTPS